MQEFRPTGKQFVAGLALVGGTGAIAREAREVPEPTGVRAALHETVKLEVGVPREHVDNLDFAPVVMRQLVVRTSTTTADVPFIPFDDSANMTAIWNSHRRRQAHIAAMSSGCFGPPLALLESMRST